MTAESIKSSSKTSRPKLPTKKLLKMKAVKNMTEREISAITGIPKTTIHTQLQELAKSEEFQYFQNNKDKVFEGLQMKLINLADHDSLKTMLSKRGFTDVAILQDKIQLLRGQATNINDLQIRVLIDNIVGKCSNNQVQSVPSGVSQQMEHDATTQIIDITNIVNDIDKID